jgi:hypothetical protein
MSLINPLSVNQHHFTHGIVINEKKHTPSVKRSARTKMFFLYNTAKLNHRK